MKTILDLLVGLPAVLVLAPLWLLPWRAAGVLGRWYGYVVFFVHGAGRRAGQINLRRFHGPSLSRRDARRATLTVFGAMGQAIGEGLNFASRPDDERRNGRVVIEMEDVELNRRILADPRPKIFVTAHLGSWEVASHFAARAAGGGAVVRRRIDNRVLDYVFHRLRVTSPFRVIDKRGGSLGALQALRAGSNVAMLADENAGPKGEWVPFLGRDASTLRTPALLACQTGSPIVVGVAVRRPNQPLLYRVALLEPPPHAGPADAAAVTRQVAAVIEGWVREYPLQWRWIHWRWKTRPDGSEERYGRRELKAAFTS